MAVPFLYRDKELVELRQLVIDGRKLGTQALGLRLRKAPGFGVMIKGRLGGVGGGRDGVQVPDLLGLLLQSLLERGVQVSEPLAYAGRLLLLRFGPLALPPRFSIGLEGVEGLSPALPG